MVWSLSGVDGETGGARARAGPLEAGVPAEAALGAEARGRHLVGGELDVDSPADAQAPAIAHDADGAPIVAWRELVESNWRGFVARWDGAKWRTVGGGAWNADPTLELVRPVMALGRGRAPVIAWGDQMAGTDPATAQAGIRVARWNGPALPRFGMEPMRDVILRAIEPPPNRLAALLSGAVDAAVLTHPETIIARRQGFNQLLFFGDHIEFVSAGVVATERNITQRPDFVRRFIRGALKTFYWLKENEKEVVARLAKATKSSETDGLELYRTGVKLFSQDGAIPRRLQERMVSLQRKVLNIEKDLRPESVYDFSFVRTANKELGKGESS